MTVRHLSEFLPKAFHDTWKAAINPNILHVVEKGDVVLENHRTSLIS